MLARIESVMDSVHGSSHHRRKNLCECVAYGFEALANSAFRGGVMVYAGTIGEFNAIRPLLDLIGENVPNIGFIVIVGQEQYAQSIHRSIPNAAVVVPTGPDPRVVDRLFELASPRLLVFSEGPCLHAHFPIRCDLSLSAACLRHGVPAIVANASLYDRAFQSRIDIVEHVLFRNLHTNAIRHWYAPNSGIRDELFSAGVPAKRISVVGDMKFDNIKFSELAPPSAELAEILSHLTQSNTPIVVAGSVNAIDEQAAVIAGWLELRRLYPKARLVIAPRYVNNVDVMKTLYEYLIKHNIRFARRSAGSAAVSEADVIVVDVFGELLYYYAHASVTYLGRNHGVLEPLRFGKPIIVAPITDWDKDHVSFFNYNLMCQAKGLLQLDDKRNIGKAFARFLEDADFRSCYTVTATEIVKTQQGAAQRIFNDLQQKQILGPVRRSGSAMKCGPA